MVKNIASEMECLNVEMESGEHDAWISTLLIGGVLEYWFVGVEDTLFSLMGFGPKKMMYMTRYSK